MNIYLLFVICKTTKHTVKKMFHQREENNKNSYNKKIMEPYLHIAQAPGKRILLEMCQASNNWLNIPEDKLQKIKEIAEIFYNIALVTDDIEDGSVLRRSVPAAHQIYGIPFSLNSTLYMMGVCWKKVYELGHFQAIDVIGRKITDLFLGMGLDIYFRENLICPTIEQYKETSAFKAGSLYTMTVQLMQLFSDKKYDFSKLGELIGIFLQIRGDYLMSCEKYSERKPFCDDISEGKFSLPIIHAIQSQPDNASNKVLNILKQKPQDFERKQYCLTLLKQFGSFDYTKQFLETAKKELIEEVNKIGENPMMLNIINNILTLE